MHFHLALLPGDAAMTEHKAKVVTSAANPVIKKIRSLGIKKYRDETGLFVAEGLRHITEALEAGWTLDILAVAPEAKDHPLTQKAIAACTAAKGLYLEVGNKLLGRLTQRDNAQSVLGVFVQQWHRLDRITGKEKGLWIGLENIRDPGNLGTIMRTADAVGAQGIVLIGKTCDPFSTEAIRASMGSFARVNMIRATLPEFLDWRKDFQGRLIGTHLRTDTDYRHADVSLPLMLVMGNEQAGISDEIAAACDTLVKIPMTGKADSLNLAVSTGVMLYEIRRDTL